MPCQHVKFANGTTAIVCTGHSRRVRCTGCHELVVDHRLCDWKTADGKTCDAKVCVRCSTSPAPEKDLCREHAAAWARHPANRSRAA